MAHNIYIKMSINNNENIISSNKFLNGSNYRIWYDSINTVVEQLELEEYLEKDVVQELYDNDPTNIEAIKKAKWENKRVRLIIINSITPKIHEDIIGIEAASAIIESLKTEYNSEANDLT